MSGKGCCRDFDAIETSTEITPSIGELEFHERQLTPLGIPVGLGCVLAASPSPR
jgi:hypothetical protein